MLSPSADPEDPGAMLLFPEFAASGDGILADDVRRYVLYSWMALDGFTHVLVYDYFLETLISAGELIPGPPSDATDGGSLDGAVEDAGATDGSVADGASVDGGVVDAGSDDAVIVDASAPDLATADRATEDVGSADLPLEDASVVDILGEDRRPEDAAEDAR
jgi:hypothetical protein